MPVPLIEMMEHVPLWLVGLIVMIVAEVYAVGLMLSTRAIYGVSRLAENNEVAGFKFAVVGVFYAVLLAFVVIAVWEEYRGTEAAVRNEAKAVVDLHHVTFAFPVESGTVIRERLVTYADHVRKFEWPAMARGKSSDHVGEDLERLSTAVFQIEPQNLKELRALPECPEAIDVDCRQPRRAHRQRQWLSAASPLVCSDRRRNNHPRLPGVFRG
jgi:Protein of unknown function (DUF4239)